MIKNVVRFEYKVGERSYQFLCENDSPAGEAFDALSKFKSHVLGVIQSQEQPKEEGAK